MPFKIHNFSGPADIRVYPDDDELGEAAADFFSGVVKKIHTEHRAALVALSGGNTPKHLYRVLSSEPYRQSIHWDQIHFFWSDERMVAPQDPQSNYHQAKISLFDSVPIPEGHIHRIKGELPTWQAVQDYRLELSRYAAGGNENPQFDLIILGLGEDGHTASLFPGRPHPDESREPVLAVRREYRGAPADRMTFTPYLINRAARICFMITGTEKAQALAGTLQGIYDPDQYPAQRIQPAEGSITWLLDGDAASRLK